MRLVPSRRIGWIIAGLAALVLVTFPVWRGPAQDAVDRIRQDRRYDGAADRTSEPAPDGEALELPSEQEAPGAGAGEPDIALEAVAAIGGASAVVDPAGDGPVLVATLAGEVLAVDLATGTDEVALDLTGEVSTGGERGLLGAAADPTGERLYLNYTDLGGDTQVRSWALVDGRPEGDAGDGVLHLAIGQPAPNHNGGNLVFGPDGALWIGTGDGGGSGDPADVAQDTGSLLGKLLRVVPRPEGGVEAPTTNPDWGGRPELWGIGLRNPWRYSFDRATNLLWVADVGEAEAEEVTVVDPSTARPNFGWNEVEGDLPFDGEPSEDFLDPALTYDHGEGCSITGGYVYRGEALVDLQGWYLFSDFCGGWIRAVPADDPGQEPVELVAPGDGQVIAFAELEDGELLVLGTEGISRIVAG